MPIASVPTLLAALAESPKPVVARVGGPARAGGIGLIAACDVALAGRSATFAFTEVRLGVVPAVISVPVLPVLAPRAARELFLTGEVFDATRAAEIGLVSRVVDDADLDAEVARYVDMLALGAPGALAATKRPPRPPVRRTTRPCPPSPPIASPAPRVAKASPPSPRSAAPPGPRPHPDSSAVPGRPVRAGQ